MRGEALPGATYRLITPYGYMRLTLNWKNGKPYETFIGIGDLGTEYQALLEGLSRMISLHLRKGGHINQVINQLRGISAEYGIVTLDERTLFSLPDAISFMLGKLYEVGPPESQS
jgi:ribonucleoside-diphosphate reductase alpha chain